MKMRQNVSIFYLKYFIRYEILHRICITWLFMIIDHNFHSMIMVFIDNIFHTYFVHDPYLVKDYHMFIIRFLLLLLHEDDGSKAGWNVNRLSVRGGNIYRGRWLECVPLPSYVLLSIIFLSFSSSYSDPFFLSSSHFDPSMCRYHHMLYTLIHFFPKIHWSII